ncbi:MAG: hypothetical protein IJV01_00795 [Bacteroidales bacterium]|nr:hypothetical protein [Bacteroidales bacterium]
MKTSFCLGAACLLALLSCNSLKLPTHAGDLRLEHQGTGLDGSEREEPPEGPARDTAVYLSAVSVPSGYDWHRDTACGAAACRLVLLRNYETVCSFPSGYDNCVSTDPDTHHLLGGRLYTEFSTQSETVLKCNGEELFRYEGREKLRGLLLRDGAVYTLGQDRSGHGCSLRRNGVTLFHSERGRIAGDFSHPAGKGNGALYEQGGHLYFAFFPDENDPRNCCLVEDGYATYLTPPDDLCTLFDLRMGPDGPWILYRDVTSIMLRTGTKTHRLTLQYWNYGAIADTEDMTLHGEMDLGAGVLGFTYLYKKGRGIRFLRGRGHQVFPFPEGDFASVQQTDEGGVCICSPEETLFQRDSCLFFSRSCADVLGTRLLAGLSPFAAGAKPFVWDGGERRELELEGFLTGLEVVLTPARTEGDLLPDQP